MRPGFDPWVGKIPWRRSWQPTKVFLPGESHGQRSLAGYSPPGHKELGATEGLSTAPHTGSKAALLPSQQANKPGDEVLRQEEQLYSGSQCPRRWLTRVLRYRLIGAWVLVSFLEQEGGRVRK